MIRSIPNPPMNKEDVSRFRANLKKHLNKDFNEAERTDMAARNARANANAKRIIKNSGGTNPILGY